MLDIIIYPCIIAAPYQGALNLDCLDLFASAFTKDSAKYVPIEQIRARMTITKVNLARNLNSLKRY